MKTSSAKAKGRRLQQWVANKISVLTGLPCGKDELIESREMGQSGVDVKLIGIARKLFPFSVECKSQEIWSVPAYIKQAKKNGIPNTDWILFIKRNREDPVVCMDADAFFKLMKQIKFDVNKKPTRLKEK